MLGSTTVATWLGFTASGGAGSHKAYSRPGEPTLLNFQKLIDMIDKYEDEL